MAAVTGATGFLGRSLVRALQGDGWRVRALVRRPPGDWTGGVAPEIVSGDLEDAAALGRLCGGAHAVIHLAGLTGARRDADFDRVNAHGAGVVATTARAEAVPKATFLLVSSLAAREPALSAYARSKRAGEAAVRAAWGADAEVARPCAIYGPGDRASAPLFRAAATWPVLPLPASRSARLPLVHVDDCARDLARMVAVPLFGRIATLTDDRPEGYGWREIAETLARAAGGRRRLLPMPAALLLGAGLAADLARALGADTLASTGKMREILHGDWSVPPEERLPNPVPKRSLLAGLTETLRTLRAETRRQHPG